MKVFEVINKIEKEARINKKNSLNKEGIKNVKKIDINQSIRQGDIYITRVKNDHPVGEEVNKRQLVDGVSLGARHILVGDDIRVYKGIKHPVAVNNIYPISYAFDYQKGSCIVTHPEHDNFIINVPGRYQVTQQMDWRTKEKILD